jgi:hypothetical protein
MGKIYDTNDSFNFENLTLTKPTLLAGGNYFIRFLMNDMPLYIQPPKCKTKQGIVKAGKKFYTDLMFTNENAQFIRWMENLENYCAEYIYKNRSQWFEGEMDLHDIENYFTSPLKIYKSGNYYIARTNIGNVLGKPTIKIYDENEQEVNFENINDKTNVVTILEIEGIKCSARSFQIEIELRQMMQLNPVNLFEKCIIKTANHGPTIEDMGEKTNTLENEMSAISTDYLASNDIGEKIANEDEERNTIMENITIKEEQQESNLENTEVSQVSLDNQYSPQNNDSEPEKPNNNMDIQEIEFHLEELPETDKIQIKQRNDVYYEMYREARRKAKIAKDLALSSYLEAKRIKNTYLLDDIKDSDDSDLEKEEDSISFNNI